MSSSKYCKCCTGCPVRDGICTECRKPIPGALMTPDFGTEPPKHVRVVGVDFPLHIRSKNVDTHLDDKYGYCDHARGHIVMCDGNSETQMRETSLHEILHAIEVATQTKLDEEDLHRIGRALYAVIRDNPDYVDWLQNV